MSIAAMAGKNHRAEDFEKFVNYKSFCWVTIKFVKVHFEIKKMLKIYFHY